MALSMATPFKHPKTGIFWLRRRVPKDLTQVLGRREVLCSLGTRDPGEAKRLFAHALADLETKWSGLRRGPKTVSEHEAFELAKPIYESLIAAFVADPRAAENWDVELYDRVYPKTQLAEPRAVVVGKASYLHHP